MTDPSLQNFLFFYNYSSLLSVNSILGTVKQDHGLSDVCESGLTRLQEALLMGHNDEAWVLRMTDSWGRIPDGILSGHISMLGDMDECIDSIYSDPVLHFTGKFCFAHLVPGIKTKDMIDTILDSDALVGVARRESEVNVEGVYNQLYPTWGICIPSSCSRTDAARVLSPITRATNGSISPVVISCYTNQKAPLDWLDYIVLTVIVVVLALTIIATSADMLLTTGKEEGGASMDSILHFSLCRGMATMLNSTEREGDFGSLNGLRVLSTFWIILVHMAEVDYVYLRNPVQSHSLFQAIVIGGLFGVDTFFVVGACLLSYRLLKSLSSSEGKFNPVSLLLRRYIRLTPLYAFFIGIYATWYPYLSTGPLWDVVEMESQTCRELGWINLLYIHNLQPGYESCFGIAWYLDVDMQFYFLSPTLVYLMWRWKRFGYWLIIMLVASSSALTSIAFATGLSDHRELYVEPWYRFGPYGIGLLCGWILWKLEEEKRLVPRCWIMIGWILSGSTLLGLLIGPWLGGWTRPELGDLTLTRVVYMGLSKTLWGLATSWIVVACAKGLGSGWINSILSQSIWGTLTPITYAMYLLNVLAKLNRARARQPLEYDEFNMITDFFGYSFLILVVGTVCHLLVELPLTGLLNTFLTPTERTEAVDKYTQLK